MGQKSSGPGALMSWRKNENEKEFILNRLGCQGETGQKRFGLARK
jgi:hypothetical protein